MRRVSPRYELSPFFLGRQQSFPLKEKKEKSRFKSMLNKRKKIRPRHLINQLRRAEPRQFSRSIKRFWTPNAVFPRVNSPATNRRTSYTRGLLTSSCKRCFRRTEENRPGWRPSCKPRRTVTPRRCWISDRVCSRTAGWRWRRLPTTPPHRPRPRRRWLLLCRNCWGSKASWYLRGKEPREM